MRKGINQWAFPEGLSAKDCLKLARDAGFDGVELNVSEDGPLSINTPEARLEELHSFALDVGIALPSLCTEIPYRLTADDKEERKRAHEAISKSLHVATVLGADTVIVCTGGRGFLDLDWQ